MLKIILFNGPPRCGKDTAALHCFRNLPKHNFGIFDRMSMPIKRAFAATVGLNISGTGDVEHWEARKEEVIPGFGVSYRQWQIDFSEKFMKPLYGNDIFGKLFISRQKRQHREAVVFVPDCGFNTEYEALATEYGEENVLVVKIFRDGTSFSGDSRNYIEVPARFVAEIWNYGTKAAFQLDVLNLVEKWLANDKT
jgi:hypothetical protein